MTDKKAISTDEQDLVSDLAGMLKVAGWRDICDAQHTGLRACIPHLRMTFEPLAQKQAEAQKPPFPGTASMYACEHRLAVTEEWMRGWNACLDAIDRMGGFRRG